VAVGRTDLLPPVSSGGASMVRPWLRFHTPLIEPDMRRDRIRLSDKTSRLHPRHVMPKPAQAYEPEVPVKVRGWTAQLVTDALVMAIWRRGKPDALPHHSDRGSQYTSEQFQRLMADHGVVCSMSRSGNVWDNAAMESFFSSLKTERTARKTYRTRDEANADVFDYIERFYNPKRRHSTIGYLSPMEFEMQAGLA